MCVWWWWRGWDEPPCPPKLIDRGECNGVLGNEPCLPSAGWAERRGSRPRAGLPGRGGAGGRGAACRPRATTQKKPPKNNSNIENGVLAGLRLNQLGKVPWEPRAGNHVSHGGNTGGFGIRTWPTPRGGTVGARARDRRQTCREARRHYFGGDGVCTLITLGMAFPPMNPPTPPHPHTHTPTHQHTNTPTHRHQHQHAHTHNPPVHTRVL